MLAGRTTSKEITEKVGEKVTIYGWVASRRDHGKIIFLDIRDRWGLIQVVFLPGNDSYEKATDSRSDDVLCIEGTVNNRPPKMVNDKIPTGTIELLAEKTEVLSRSKTPPFEINSTDEINEEVRLKFRYLDLRTERMLENLKKRSKVINFVRGWLSNNDFIEIETPILTKSTPEGARDYIVPSRLQKDVLRLATSSPTIQTAPHGGRNRKILSDCKMF
jgi:aspartyl-tRNA synthetase